MSLELSELRNRISAARRERLDLQRKVASGVTNDSAIARMERDIDAMTTPSVIALRASVEDLAERFQRAWAGADWHRLVIARMRSRAVPIEALPHFSQLSRALAEEADSRGVSAARLMSAGIPIDVPEASAPLVEAHPDRDSLAARYEWATADPASIRADVPRERPDDPIRQPEPPAGGLR